MAMREYPIMGYGIGISWNDKESILNLLSHPLVKEGWDAELDLTGDEEKDSEMRYESFMDDPQNAMEEVSGYINKYIYDKYPEEKFGIGYEIANDYHVMLMFHHVKYGVKPGMTTDEVDSVIFDIAKEVFKPTEEELEKDGMENFVYCKKNGLYGDIYTTYFA